ncbi:MAG TPA: glycosyltransferase [Vicinamibacterales bacterium]|jgi:glycosyltransferase involved in cell wall biosynthesis
MDSGGKESATPSPRGAEAPKVSVLVVTYNHERFIRSALESALSQSTDFPFEIVVGDDASTDRTRRIVESIAAEHPGTIVPLLHDHNLGGLGSRNFLTTIARARGRYLAILEGDDLYTDSTKLQRQADFLDANPDCAGCFHDCATIDEHDRPLQARFPLKLRVPRVTERDVVAGGNNAVTNTRMFRRECVERFPSWYLAHTMDWGLEILVAGFGDWGFIDRTMSAYRVHGGGVFSNAGLVRQHELIMGMAEVLIAEPRFAPYRSALRDRLAWMSRDAAASARKSGDGGAYRANLFRFVRYARKNRGFARWVATEMLSWV